MLSSKQLEERLKVLQNEEQQIEAPTKSMKLERRGGKTFQLTDYMKINDIRTKKVSIEMKLVEINKSIKEEGALCDKEIKSFEIDLENLKFERQFAKMRLRSFYLKILASEHEILRFGRPVTKVIQALWEIKESIVYEHFTRFIDKETFEYLLKVLPESKTILFPNPVFAKCQYASLEIDLQNISKASLNEKNPVWSSSAFATERESQNKSNTVLMKSTGGFPFFNENNQLLPSDSFAGQPLKNRMEAIQSKLKDMKFRKVMRIERKTPKNKQFATVESPSPEEKPEKAKQSSKEMQMSERKAEKKVGLVELTKKMSKLQNSECQRVIKNFSQKPIDKESLKDLETYLRIILSEGRALQELNKFIKDQRVEHKKN